MDEDTETVLPIYIVGDSHALPYRNIVFRERWAGKWAVAKSKYISGLAAADFFSPTSGEFHPELIGFLQYEGLIRAGKATHLSMDEIDFAIGNAAGQSVAPPLMLFAVGDIDIRGAVMPLLRDEYDFVPPFQSELPTLDRRLLPWDIVEDAVEHRLAPLIAGLRQLSESGFNRLYVQGVPPPTRRGGRVRDLHGYDCPTTVRTKLVLAFNRQLESACKSIGVIVLDNWTKLTDGDLLRPEFEVDGVHLPPRAAQWYLEMLVEHAINSQWLALNNVRYEIFYRLACGLQPFESRSETRGAG